MSVVELVETTCSLARWSSLSRPLLLGGRACRDHSFSVVELVETTPSRRSSLSRPLLLGGRACRDHSFSVVELVETTPSSVVELVETIVRRSGRRWRRRLCGPHHRRCAWLPASGRPLTVCASASACIGRPATRRSHASRRRRGPPGRRRHRRPDLIRPTAGHRVRAGDSYVAIVHQRDCGCTFGDIGRRNRAPAPFGQDDSGSAWGRDVWLRLQTNPLWLRAAYDRPGPARVRRRVASRLPRFAPPGVSRRVGDTAPPAGVHLLFTWHRHTSPL